MRAEKGRENVNRQLELYRNLIEARLRAARDAILTIKTALTVIPMSLATADAGRPSTASS